MAIAYEGAADLGNNGGSGSLSQSYTVNAASNLLLVFFLGINADGTDHGYTVTAGGNAMTKRVSWLTGVGVGGANRCMFIYELLNPPTGSITITITNPPSDYIVAGAADYSGVNAFDASATGGSATVSTLTTSVTTTVNNDWAMMFGQNYNNGPMTAGSGATRRMYGAAFNDWAFFDSAGAITPAGSYSMTDNTSASNPSIINLIASYSPAAAAAVLPYRRPSRTYLTR